MVLPHHPAPSQPNSHRPGRVGGYMNRHTLCWTPPTWKIFNMIGYQRPMPTRHWSQWFPSQNFDGCRPRYQHLLTSRYCCDFTWFWLSQSSVLWQECLKRIIFWNINLIYIDKHQGCWPNAFVAFVKLYFHPFLFIVRFICHVQINLRISWLFSFLYL